MALSDRRRSRPRSGLPTGLVQPRRALVAATVLLLPTLLLGGCAVPEPAADGGADAAAPAAVPAPPAPGVDLLIDGGVILTMNPGQPEVEALAVHDGRVVAAGSRASVAGLAGAATRHLDLQGQALLPGFVEPHSHPVLSALLYDWVDISGFRHDSAAAVWAEIEQAVAAAGPGERIYAFGFDPLLVPGLQEPTLAQLDALAPDKPLFVLMQSMHTAWVNSAALRAAGVTEAAADPGGASRFGRDSRGQLSGRLEEAGAMAPFLGAAVNADAATYRRLLAAQYRRYAARGITTVGAVGLFLPVADIAAVLALESDAGEVPLRMQAWLYPQQFDAVAALPAVAASARFHPVGVKVWYDGSPYTGSMLLDAPYRVSPLAQEGLGIEAGSFGAPNYETDDLRTLLQPFHDRGLSVAVHAQGDRAVRETLDVLINLSDVPSAPSDRSGRIGHRIEHGLLFPLADLQRAAAADVSASFHVNHLYYYGDELIDDLLGEARMADALPLASAELSGLLATVHADSPMYPPDPLLLVRSAVTRLSSSGRLVGFREALELDAALAAVTRDAALQLGLADQVGQLTPGLAADMVVLERDPRQVPPADLHRIEVRGTFISGRQVWP